MAVKGFRVKVKPSGLINGRDWPEVGEVIELDEDAANGMVETGWLEPAKAERSKAEKRPAKKAEPEKRD